jgi:acylpyruvate hydrolase
MKLLTYSLNGRVAHGALMGDDVVDLACAFRAALSHAGAREESAAHVPADLHELLLGGEAALAAARDALRVVEADLATRRIDPREVCRSFAMLELLPPIRRPGKIVCVGLNYRCHLAEIGESEPEFPILFTKPSTSLIGQQHPIVLPRVSRQVDYEGELAVVIGRRGKYIPEREALSYVAGYTCANDVSAHDIEFRTSQWTSGKMLDTFCPLGPVLATADEIPDPGSLRLRTTLNGQTVQDAGASAMVFPVPFLISYISSLATLEPGDVILTGTPAGVGCNRQPQVFLKPADQVTVEIEGIGRLFNPVIAEAGS